MEHRGTVADDRIQPSLKAAAKPVGSTMFGRLLGDTVARLLSMRGCSHEALTGSITLALEVPHIQVSMGPSAHVAWHAKVHRLEHHGSVADD